MEVMSMLLCAFVATLPQTLGISKINRVLNTDVRFNSSIWIENTLRSRRHRVLNVNAPPLVNIVTELQAAFRDYRCQQCINCMEWALRGQARRSFIVSSQYPDNLYYDVKRENFQISRKFKRSIPNDQNDTEPDAVLRNKTLNNVTVTKFTNNHGKIYAIKVTELNKQIPRKEKKSTCKLYTVRKTLSCGTPKSDLILTKSKANYEGVKKKGKKSKNLSTTTEKLRLVSLTSKKPDVEASHAPAEGFMPSIEDFY